MHHGSSRRGLILWLLVGGGFTAVAGMVGLILLIVIIAVVFLGGFGYWIQGLFTGAAPPMGTNTARTLEWLVAVDHADPSLPNALSLAVIAQASGGQVYGDRRYCVQGTQEQSSGIACHSAYGTAWHDLGAAYGLTGVNSKDVPFPNAGSGTSPHSVRWNLATGLGRLNHVLTTDPVLQTALPTFHRTTQAPPHWIFSHYATTIRQDMATYGGAQMAAWAIASWNKVTGVYQDPHGKPEWVLVAAGAPTGAPWTLEWKPPTIKYVQKTKHVSTTKRVKVKVKVHGKWTTKTKTVHGTKTVHYTVRQVIDHNLTGRAVEVPVGVFATLSNGTSHALTYSGVHPNIPVWPGGIVWGAQLDLHKITQITAVWPGFRETMRWPPVAGQAIGVIHLVNATQSIGHWWPDIQTASHDTGVPASLIAAIMVHESQGDPNAFNPLGPAFGLMQILSSTAVGLPGYNPATWTQPQENLILGAELLKANEVSTGGWHAAIAAYYGGLGTMEGDGYIPGMPWSTASGILNVVPAPQAGNTQTMTSYADQMIAESQLIAKHKK